MDRAILLEHLAKSEAHIAQGNDHIVKQYRIVRELREGGHDTAEAEKLLRLLEEFQALHVADKERIVRELAQHSQREAQTLSNRDARE